MSKFGKNGVRCDWCGKIANNDSGEYSRPVKNAFGFNLAGYIRSPDWERNEDGSYKPGCGTLDICEECAADKCPLCGSDQIVHTTPTVPGPTGWGGRCKACGGRWGMTDTTEKGA